MANRGMSAAMLTEIAKPENYIVHLVYIETSPALYITTAHKQVTFNFQNYSPLGQLLKIPDIEESLSINSGTINLSLTGVDQSIISAVLAQKLINRDIDIYLGFLNTSGDLVADPLQIFKGIIENYNASEDSNSKTSRVEVSAASHWVDFEKTSGRRTNDADQQLLFPGDDGFRHTSEIIKDLQWG
mgnify:CR=1 FL=1